MNFARSEVRLAVAVWLFMATPVRAEYYALDAGDLVGTPLTVTARQEDTLLDIARFHGQGYGDIRLANPHLDAWLPGAGAQVHIPARYVLPWSRQRGLILNVPEMRLYYFLPGQRRVWTYPVGIGRRDGRSPLSARVLRRRKSTLPGPRRSRSEMNMPPWANRCRRTCPRPGQPPGRPCHSPVAAELPHPRHQQALRDRHARQSRLRTHVPGGRGGTVRADPGGSPVEIVNQPIKAGLDETLCTWRCTRS